MAVYTLWGVVSDSHGDRGALSNIMLMLEYKKVAGVIHLGDGFRDMEPYTSAFTVHQVCGNCDYACPGDTASLIRLSGVPIFITHGHRFYVKDDTGLVQTEAASLGAKAALFGHTHCQHLSYEGGILLMNPGAASYGRYGLLKVYPEGLVEGELC